MWDREEGSHGNAELACGCRSVLKLARRCVPQTALTDPLRGASMAKHSGFERLRGWLRSRTVGADADIADVGTTYGMELCLQARDRRPSSAIAKATGKVPANRRR